jgi:two-component system, chemotaxis family, protein-glutamate methylesterase/glutaminase
MMLSMAVANGSYRLYVVEDSDIMLRLLLEMLGGIRGVRVVGHSADAEEAIVEIGRSMPDAIIVDLLLQCGTGFDVLQRAVRQNAKPPLAMVLTNLSMAPNPDQAKSLGAAYFFDKATEIVKMFRTVVHLADEHRKRADYNHS